MIPLKGIPLPSLPVSGLEKVQDLDQHDGGALISHFRHSRGNQYLYYWCDCDEKATRWMLLRLSETDILRLVNQVVPIDLVVPQECQDEFVYFVDIGPQGTQKVTLVAVSNFPEEYLPGTTYLQVPECFTVNEFALLIDKPDSSATSSANIFLLPRVFAQVYSALYAMLILKPQRYEEIPWREGFGGKRFYDWLSLLIPGEDRPEVEAFQFASPGFVKYSLRREVGDLVTKALVDLNRFDNIINNRYTRLYDYIYDKKLNELYETNANPDAWDEHNGTLTERTNALLEALRIDDKGSLVKSAAPFEAAKIALSFVRRLKELKKYEKDGMVRFPRPPQMT